MLRLKYARHIRATFATPAMLQNCVAKGALSKEGQHRLNWLQLAEIKLCSYYLLLDFFGSYVGSTWKTWKSEVGVLKERVL